MNLLDCADKVIKDLWKILKKLLAHLPEEIAKPGLEVLEKLVTGLYKCTVEGFQEAVAISKELIGGITSCWKTGKPTVDELTQDTTS